MSEREPDPRGTPWPADTGEFRAAPDASATTAEFKAFVAGGHDESAWAVTTPGRKPTAMIGVAVIAAVVVVAVILLLVR